MSIEERQQTRRESICNHGRAIKHVAGGNQGHRGSSGRLVQTTHAMAIQGHGRQGGAPFLPATRPTGGRKPAKVSKAAVHGIRVRFAALKQNLEVK